VPHCYICMYIACLVNVFLLSSKIVLELLSKSNPVVLNWYIKIKNRCKRSLEANEAHSNTIKKTQLCSDFDLARPVRCWNINMSGRPFLRYSPPFRNVLHYFPVVILFFMVLLNAESSDSSPAFCWHVLGT